MIVPLRIESLTYGGRGLGRWQGKAVFVPLTAPGDEIRCRLVRDRKSYAEGELVDLVCPSPVRRVPPCPVFGECGGCQWQHLPYPQQTRWKEEIFADILGRQARIPREQVRPGIAAAAEWGYRSRVQFKCRLTTSGFVMGFYRRGSHFVVDVSRCPITDSRLNDCLTLLRRHLPLAPRPDRIPQVDLEIGDDGRIRGVVHALDADPAALIDFLRPLGETEGFSLFLQTGRKETLRRICGEEDLLISPGGEPPLRLAYGPGGFAQVNLAQNRALIEAVVAAAGLSGRERVLDLFCGMGNFSLPLARLAAEVVGVEEFEPAIAKARQNALDNGLDNAVFHARPAEGAATALAGERGFDLAILDPPRTGAYAVVRELSGLPVRRILYVSCDPPTLGRDLTPLLHGGYRLCWSRPFDLFPQTFHTESLTLLERSE